MGRSSKGLHIFMDTSPTDKTRAVQVQIFGDALKLRFNLYCELPCRHYNENLEGRTRAKKPVDQRNEEGSGFPCAGLGNAQQIPPGEDCLKCFVLNLRGKRIPFFRKILDQLAVYRQVGDFSGWAIGYFPGMDCLFYEQFRIKG